MAKGIEAQKLKALSSELVPTLWIGKNGANAAIVLELQEQLKLRKMVKVRILKTALIESSRDEIAHELGQAQLQFIFRHTA
jgi:RNA-binding protein YhbY